MAILAKGDDVRSGTKVSACQRQLLVAQAKLNATSPNHCSHVFSFTEILGVEWEYTCERKQKHTL